MHTSTTTRYGVRGTSQETSADREVNASVDATEIVPPNAVSRLLLAHDRHCSFGRGDAGEAEGRGGEAPCFL